ncbi:hypothetical protein AB1Y20_006841 [Prymnesium parvum]|uniref:CN hydrolase domain-containing protein n=1 Tax=Prymnesium parvum TaxID=97485 RepID=A0AB34IYS9_PRYPA
MHPQLRTPRAVPALHGALQSGVAIHARGIRVAALQLDISESMRENISRAGQLINRAAADGAGLASLPECFTGKYGCDHFAKWAEPILPEPRAGSGAAMMRDSARRHGMFVTGGVIEEHEGKLFNSMPVYGPSGLQAVYRKIHLSRVLGITSESDILTAGTEPTTFEMPGLPPTLVGMLCCFDLRFRDLLAQYGPNQLAHGPCAILCAPSAFLHATGTDHWELLVRRAALDGQSYVVAPNVAFNPSDQVPLHGKSMVVDPWGRVLAQCNDSGDDIAIADVDLPYLNDVRLKLPISTLAAKFR